MEEVQAAVFEKRLVLSGRTLLPDPVVNDGSQWLHSLHTDSSQLDWKHTRSSPHVPVGGDFGGTHLQAQAIEFQLLVFVCKEVHTGLFATVDEYRRHRHFPGLKRIDAGELLRHTVRRSGNKVLKRRQNGNAHNLM